METPAMSATAFSVQNASKNLAAFVPSALVGMTNGTSGSLKDKKPMKNSFKSCCELGTYEHQTPMPIRGRRHDIDFCIADIVAALNAANIVTVASCCGHGKMDADIRLKDGRIMRIQNPKQV